jgi:hypothetical protein
MDMEDLAKQLPKMTIKELRDMAKELGAEGVSGMKKEDLLEFIRKAKGIAELKARLPYADIARFEEHPAVERIGDLYTVDMLVQYVQSKLAA